MSNVKQNIKRSAAGATKTGKTTSVTGGGSAKKTFKTAQAQAQAQPQAQVLVRYGADGFADAYCDEDGDLPWITVHDIFDPSEEMVHKYKTLAPVKLATNDMTEGEFVLYQMLTGPAASEQSRSGRLLLGIFVKSFPVGPMPYVMIQLGQGKGPARNNPALVRSGDDFVGKQFNERQGNWLVTILPSVWAYVEQLKSKMVRELHCRFETAQTARVPQAAFKTAQPKMPVEKTKRAKYAAQVEFVDDEAEEGEETEIEELSEDVDADE